MSPPHRSLVLCPVLLAGLVFWLPGGSRPAAQSAEGPVEDPFGEAEVASQQAADPFAAGDDAERQDEGGPRKGKASPEPARKPQPELRWGEEAVLSALGSPADLDFVDTPLADIVAFLGDTYRVHVRLDSRALDDVGLGSDTPISLAISGVPLRTALDLMLNELDLAWTVFSGVLLITTPEKLEEDGMLLTRVYDFSDLAVLVRDYPYQGGSLPTTPAPGGPSLGQGAGSAVPGLGGGYQGLGGFGGGGLGGGFFSVDSPLAQMAAAPSAAGAGQGGGFGGPWPPVLPVRERVDQMLANLITSQVAPSTWDTVGGPGTLSVFGRLLVVTNTWAVQERIQSLLDDLREQLRGAVTLVMDIRWLLLDSEALAELAPAGEGGGGRVAVDREGLEKIAPEATAFRGRLACFAGQQVHLAAGQRRTVVTGAVPVVGSGIGYQPVVRVPNVGIVLQLRPSLVPGTETAMLDVRSTVTGWKEGQPVRRIGTQSAPTQKVDASGQVVTEAGGKSSVDVDRVVMPAHQLATTLRVPLGQPVLVGGLTFQPPEAETGQGGRKQLYLIMETKVANP